MSVEADAPGQPLPVQVTAQHGLRVRLQHRLAIHRIRAAPRPAALLPRKAWAGNRRRTREQDALAQREGEQHAGGHEGPADAAQHLSVALRVVAQSQIRA